MRKVILFSLVIMALLLVSCSKAPAQAALKAADDAIANIKPEAEKYVPEEFKSLSAAAADAKAKFDAGDYKGSMEVAKDLPAKAAEVQKAAVAKKDELMKQWADMEGSMPAMVQGLTDKIGQLAAMKKLPKGMDATQVETAKTSLAAVTADWTAATESYKNGQVMEANAKAAEVKAKAEELTRMLEPAVPPAK